MSHLPTAKDFAEQTKNHVIEIRLNDGMHRHIKFADPTTSDKHVHISTIPGYLFYCGDMGLYTFARLSDMFVFFRGKGADINPGYWAEKVKAGETEVFCPDMFRENVWSNFDQSVDPDLDDETCEEIKSEIQSEVIDAGDDERDLTQAANDFYHPHFEFTDFWECQHTKHTYHYIWACRAIVRAIELFDEVVAS